MQKLKPFTLSPSRSLALLLLSCSLALSLCFPPPAFAQPTVWRSDCFETVQIDKYGKVGVGPIFQVATLQGLECIFENISKTIIPFAGLAVFIMLIVGSLQMLTAAGDPKQSQKASKTITSAIIGIVVIVGIWFILKLITTITGIDVTRFEVPR